MATTHGFSVNGNAFLLAQSDSNVWKSLTYLGRKSDGSIREMAQLKCHYHLK